MYVCEQFLGEEGRKVLLSVAFQISSTESPLSDLAYSSSRHNFSEDEEDERRMRSSPSGPVFGPQT